MYYQERLRTVVIFNSLNSKNVAEEERKLGVSISLWLTVTFYMHVQVFLRNTTQVMFLRTV